MSEITQPPPDVNTQDQNSRVNRLNAASDHSASNKQSAEQQTGKQPTETEAEKPAPTHDPAVTLASTLSKLDSGSNFQSSVTGHDVDGRVIIASELGTYLTEVDREAASKSQVEEYQKLKREEVLDVRVITVDKVIKAEVLKNSETETGDTRIVTIPVSLVLTDLNNPVQSGQEQQQQPPLPQTPIEDIKSQYQATTLYRAESIAREIGDKLDNLPLPTSAPNYTVYGSTDKATDKAKPALPQQVSTNVFIQEVSSSNKAAQPNETINLNLILGSNISTEVIKTVEPSAVPLPPGLPAAVVKELTTKSPLEQAQQGQNLVINIAAIAIPEENQAGAQGTNSPTPAAAPVNTVQTTVETAPNTPPKADPQNLPPSSVSTTSAAVNPPASASQGIIVSGIIIDPAQTSIKQTATDDVRSSITPQQTIAKNVQQTPYGAVKSSQTPGNTPGASSSNTNAYYLATPTTVLKLQSPIPLVPGTIVNFSVNDSPSASTAGTSNTANTAVQTTTQTNPVAPSQPNNAPSSSPTISPLIAEKLRTQPLQPLEQLTEDWASISLALSALTSTASASAASIISSRIPNMMTPEQMTSTIFFFLSALKSSTPAKTWFRSDVSDRLKRIGAGRILERVDNDFTRIARLSADLPGGEWRPTLIPFQSGGSDITAIPMVIKQISDEDKKQSGSQNQSDDEQNKKTTRFIMEINFSQFGKILIDGFLKEKKLDIILKSEKPIQPSMKTHLSEKFTTSLESSGFAGELVIIDDVDPGISVTNMVKTMAHQNNFEEKI